MAKHLWLPCLHLNNHILLQGHSFDNYEFNIENTDEEKKHKYIHEDHQQSTRYVCKKQTLWEQFPLTLYSFDFKSS